MTCIKRKLRFWYIVELNFFLKKVLGQDSPLALGKPTLQSQEHSSRPREVGYLNISTKIHGNMPDPPALSPSSPTPRVEFAEPTARLHPRRAVRCSGLAE